ncbi:winged-helix domain-containing protein [Microbacterium bovistercoris]|uniref:winged-helix domain-containing protein n=1 Tax=Microbacterium bovistercoris TaxID=2293570 RepID=UPI0015F25EDF|nr:winged-helix domain-containing protein [Microbacterium bovistercoris]
MLGFAVLKANFNANAPSYLDSFQPFILSVLAESNRPYLQREEIAGVIHDSFGIDIPNLVIKSLLRAMSKQKLTEPVGSTAVQITAKGLESAPALQQQVAQYNQRQTDLVATFEAFVADRFPGQLDSIAVPVSTLLASYFERHAAPLLNEGLRNRKGSTPSAHDGTDYVVAAFVTDLASRDHVRFAYVVEAAKGAMLSAVLLLDTSELKNSLNNLTLVLDTPVLMDALGFHGEVAEIATNQLITLATEQSAQVATFDHSVSELDGILEHVEQALRKGARSRSTSAGFLHFVEIGATPADLMLIRGKLHELLRQAGIEVIPRPDGYYQYGLDETKLENLIQSKVRYFQDAARVNDVISLSSTHRLRKGARSRTLELCRAVLVTTNVNLVLGAIEFDDRGGSFPLAAMTDSVASVLWVRSPAAAPDAPREMLLAAAYAGMQPNPVVWTKYLDEVDALEQSNSVTADEAVILRTSRISREALMEETLGISESVSPESPLTVLERVRSDATAPLEEQLRELETRAAHADTAADSASADWLRQVSAREAAESDRDKARAAAADAEAQLAQARDAEQAKLTNIRNQSNRVAHRTRAILVGIVRIAGILATIWALIVFLQLPDPSERTGVIIVGAAGLVAALALFLPPAGKSLDACERALARRVERRRLRYLGYEPGSNWPPAGDPSRP